jgi:hypothetical protein
MIALFLKIIFEPRLAAHAASFLVGAPELGEALENICERESHCKIVLSHVGDAWASRWVRPDECAGVHANFSTWGSFGLMAGYSLHHLPEPFQCSPWILSLPLVSAYVAAKRSIAPRCRQVLRCRSWRGW